MLRLVQRDGALLWKISEGTRVTLSRTAFRLHNGRRGPGGTRTGSYSRAVLGIILMPVPTKTQELIMRGIVLGFVFAVTAPLLVGQTAPEVQKHEPQGVVSDWTSHHVLYPESKDGSAMARNQNERNQNERNQNDPRWLQSWYLRHQESWWPEHRRWHHRRRHRDWSVSLSANPSMSAFEPLFDFSYTMNLDTGYGSVNTTDNGSGQYLATSGFLSDHSYWGLTTQTVARIRYSPGGPAQHNQPKREVPVRQSPLSRRGSADRSLWTSLHGRRLRDSTSGATFQSRQL